MDMEHDSWRELTGTEAVGAMATPAVSRSGRSWTAALAAAWITVTGSAQAPIPLVARALD
jgi:hypothetical protein